MWCVPLHCCAAALLRCCVPLLLCPAPLHLPAVHHPPAVPAAPTVQVLATLSSDPDMTAMNPKTMKQMGGYGWVVVVVCGCMYVWVCGAGWSTCCMSTCCMPTYLRIPLNTIARTRMPMYMRMATATIAHTRMPAAPPPPLLQSCPLLNTAWTWRSRAAWR